MVGSIIDHFGSGSGSMKSNNNGSDWTRNTVFNIISDYCVNLRGVEDHYATWNTIGGRGRMDALYDTETGGSSLLISV